jgi:hypothetical protein
MSDVDKKSSRSPSPEADTSKPESEQEAGSSKPASTSPDPSPSTSTPNPGAPSAGAWQAIWSPQYNTYYFFNSETNETTWENPLVKSEDKPSEGKEDPREPGSGNEDVSGAGPSGTPYTAAQQAAIAQGIDPSLAYLDPTLAGPAGSSGAYAATAKFNAHTGHFAKSDARDPSHLSEYERAKRMSEFYFDVNAWEQQRALEQEEEAAAEANGKKRKRPTKKDLVSFYIHHSLPCIHQV